MAQLWTSKLKVTTVKKLGLALLLIFLLILPLIITSGYYNYLVIMTEMNAVLSMTFLLLFMTGLISLGIAVFWGIGAYASTILVMKIGMSFWLAMPTAMIITAIISLIVGLVIMSSHGFAFLILTTVIGMIFSLLIGMVPYLGGTQGIQNIPPPNSIKLPFLLIDFSTRLPNYYLMFFLLLIVVVVLWAFYSAWIGKAWRAIGLNPNLAAAMGINVFKYRLSAFVLASAIAGLMGSFYASYIGAITPTSFGMMQTILIHIKAIIGGIGFALLGPIVGSAVMTFMPEVFRVFKEYGDVMTGILLILIVLFLPNGILGLTRRKVPPQLLNILKANFSITTPKKTKGSDVTSTKHQ